MSADIPTMEPREIIAGDTITWKKSLSDYPATDGWTLKYRLINATAKYDITAVADGADHLVTITTVTSALYTAGTYTRTAYVEKGSGATLERVTLNTDLMVIQPDLAAATAGMDLRSSAKIALDAINAALATYGKKAYTQSYTVNGREVTFKSNEEFMKMRAALMNIYIKEQNAERIKQGLLPITNTRKVVFRNA